MPVGAPALSGQVSRSLTSRANSAFVPTMANELAQPFRKPFVVSLGSILAVGLLDLDLTAGEAAVGVDLLGPALHGVDRALEQAGRQRGTGVGHDRDRDLVALTPISVASSVTPAHGSSAVVAVVPAVVVAVPAAVVADPPAVVAAAAVVGAAAVRVAGAVVVVVTTSTSCRHEAEGGEHHQPAKSAHVSPLIASPDRRRSMAL